MAQVTGALPAPTSVFATLVSWGATSSLVDLGDVSALSPDSDVTLGYVRLGESGMQLRTYGPGQSSPGTSGPQLTDDWEQSAIALTIRAPTLADLVIVGPNHPGVASGDETEPYAWTPSAQQLADSYDPGGVAGWLTAFRALTAEQQAACTYILDDGIPIPEDHAVDAGSASFAFALPQPEVTHTAAPTPAAITGIAITSMPGFDPGNTGANNTYGLGEIFQITVTYDGPVDVTGTPGLPINLGQSPSGSPEYADYVGGSGTAEIVFEWEVAATDQDTNGIFLYANRSDDAFRLTNATIRNAGTTVDAAARNLLLGGTQSGHRVDGSLESATDHAVDAGSASFAFATVEPETARSRARDADAAAWAFETPQPSVTKTSPTGTEYAVNAGAASFAFEAAQPEVTHAERVPEAHEVDAGSASWAFATPEPDITTTGRELSGDHPLTYGIVTGPPWLYVDGSRLRGVAALVSSTVAETHSARIRAFDASGQAVTKDISINVDVFLQPPTGATQISVSDITDGTAVLSWPSLAGATSYDLEVDGTVTNITGLQASISFTRPATISVRIRGRNSDGPSATWSTLQSLAFLDAPAAPTLTSAVPSLIGGSSEWGAPNEYAVTYGAAGSGVNSCPASLGFVGSEYVIGWPDIPGVTGWLVQSSPTPNFDAAVAIDVGTNREYTVIASGSDRYFRIAAVATGGQTLWSDHLHAVQDFSIDDIEFRLESNVVSSTNFYSHSVTLSFDEDDVPDGFKIGVAVQVIVLPQVVQVRRERVVSGNRTIQGTRGGIPTPLRSGGRTTIGGFAINSDNVPVNFNQHARLTVSLFRGHTSNPACGDAILIDSRQIPIPTTDPVGTVY